MACSDPAARESLHVRLQVAEQKVKARAESVSNHTHTASICHEPEPRVEASSEPSAIESKYASPPPPGHAQSADRPDTHLSHPDYRCCVTTVTV